MGQVKQLQSGDGSVGTIDVDSEYFGLRAPRRILREAVIMYRANLRAGTHDTLDRSEVRATKKKPWKQKSTGRARAGKRSSPIWRGGGVAHGPHPRDYSYGMPRKALRVAARAAIAAKFLDGEVVTIDQIALDAPRTKTVAAMLAALDVKGTFLMVTPERDDNVYRSTRNIPGARVMAAAEVNAYEVLKHRTLILVGDAMERLQKRLGSADSTRED